MQDVQKELFTLRELVHEIANNSTKNEKTLKLKEEGKRHKTNALQLLAESDELRAQIRSRMKKTYTVGENQLLNTNKFYYGHYSFTRKVKRLVVK